MSTLPKTSAQLYKNSNRNSGHRFQPLPNLKVKGYCEWEMRLNTDFNRIPPIITELVCSNPETTCSGNTFFKVIYTCRHILGYLNIGIQIVFVFVKNSVCQFPRAQVILLYFPLAASGQPKPSLKIRTANAIFPNYLDLIGEYGLGHIFLRIKLFCFSR